MLRDVIGQAVQVRREVSRLEDLLQNAALETIPVVSYIDAIDESSSTIYMSPRIERLVGYSIAEWEADPELWTKLLHPDDRDDVISHSVMTNASGEPFCHEYRLLARDGRVVWVRDEAVLVRDEAGRPEFWEGVLIDITERKRAERLVAAGV